MAAVMAVAVEATLDEVGAKTMDVLAQQRTGQFLYQETKGSRMNFSVRG